MEKDTHLMVCSWYSGLCGEGTKPAPPGETAGPPAGCEYPNSTPNKSAHS